jgi:hypothetical protein
MTAQRKLEARGVKEIPLSEARNQYAYMMGVFGFKPRAGEWFTLENVKLRKDKRVAMVGMSLLPANKLYALTVDMGLSYFWQKLARGFNVCTSATPACMRGCLNTSGKGRLARTQRSRGVRSMMWAAFPDAAYTLTVHAIRTYVAKYGTDGVAIRLNILSDVIWERVLPAAFWEEFAGVQFYDYTKHAPAERAGRPANYDLTYSASERWSPVDIRTAAATARVAVVLGIHPEHEKPAEYLGFPLIDGDKTDARWLEPTGIVGLGWKGDAKAQRVGWNRFVKPVA